MAPHIGLLCQEFKLHFCASTMEGFGWLKYMQRSMLVNLDGLESWVENINWTLEKF